LLGVWRVATTASTDVQPSEVEAFTQPNTRDAAVSRQ
jgi:hypothetical protein